jgi:GH15 family glucan-1,4-alpha-glucosidase
MDSIYLANKYGTAMPYDAWGRARQAVEFVYQNWQNADAGIWEIRDAPREFLHSRLMC